MPCEDASHQRPHTGARIFCVGPPPYAILSHTWGNEEVTFADFTNSDQEKSRHKTGYKKIALTCDQAKRHKVNYAWVDTCCINKDSSAELSEAINSMYQWYGSSKFCYAYLEDAAPPHDPDMVRHTLKECKWLSRGWTLQELLAPAEVIFYRRDWSEIGRKTELCDILHDITGIPQDVLRKEKPFEDISVAARMSWAAKRHTKRKEDLAYCLMGIFDVNMPLLYGEGDKAFIRLQEHIMSQVQDDTLFAWCSDAESASRFPYRGLLATSPRDFRDCADLMHFGGDDAGTTHLIGNGKVSLRCTVQVDADKIILGLGCSRGDLSKRKGIDVVRVGLGSYIRRNPSRLANYSSRVLEDAVIDKYALREKVSPPDDIFRRDAVHLGPLPRGVHLRAVRPSETFSPTQRTVSVIDALHKKVAFELEYDQTAFNFPASVSGFQKKARLLLVLWVEQHPGLRSFSYYFDVVRISFDVQKHLANAIKPQEIHKSREFRNGWSKISVLADHRQVQGHGMLSLDLQFYSDEARRCGLIITYLAQQSEWLEPALFTTAFVVPIIIADAVTAVVTGSYMDFMGDWTLFVVVCLFESNPFGYGSFLWQHFTDPYMMNFV